MESASCRLVSHSVISETHFFGCHVSQMISPAKTPSLTPLIKCKSSQAPGARARGKKLNIEILNSCSRVKLSSVSVHSGVNNI